MGSPESEPVEPTTDPAVREIYDRRYLAFKGLYPALKQLFGELRDGVLEQPRAGQEGVKPSISETGGEGMTWSVGAGGLGKQT
jgi:hypothetical protein